MPRHHCHHLLVLSVALALSARAAAAPCGEGVWRGTLGKEAVSLEIDKALASGDTLAGRYYRGGSLDELVLTPLAGHPDAWQESDLRGHPTGVLRLTCADGRLAGVRTAAHGGASDRLAAGAIERDAYGATRLAGLKLRITRLVVLDERRAWQEFTVPGASGLQGLRFLGDGPGVAALNEKLLKHFTDKLEEALWCRVLGFIDRGPDHNNYREDESKVIAYGDALVAISNHNEGACGGAHGGVGNSVRTWNLVTQEWEDVSKWLLPDWLTLASTGELDPEGGPAAEPRATVVEAPEQDEEQPVEPRGSALSRFLDTSGREEREECGDAVTVKFDGAHMWAQAEGLGVAPETRGDADRLCAVAFTIPYDLLWPYLTEAGRRHAADLIRSPRPDAHSPL
ncbi:hypothetical protein E7V67_010195 [[Empedobacter] haloabium]|uniref:Uncharacterized protein n=1 Tax=[Empedobacter] haloabium TaxID=592317 RepID=A0ABZ1URT1_9BURK